MSHGGGGMELNRLAVAYIYIYVYMSILQLINNGITVTSLVEECDKLNGISDFKIVPEAPIYKYRKCCYDLEEIVDYFDNN